MFNTYSNVPTSDLHKNGVYMYEVLVSVFWYYLRNLLLLDCLKEIQYTQAVTNLERSFPDNSTCMQVWLQDIA